MRAEWLLLFAICAGCGAPLVDGSYRGEPLYNLSGHVRMDGVDPWDPRLEGNLRVALFWAEGEGEQPLEQRQEQAVITTTEFPARYTISLYAPPPEGSLFRASWSGNTDIGVATPLLYDDLNGNNRWDAGMEELVGGSADVALVFATEAPTVGEGMFPFVELAPGFQTMYSASDPCSNVVDAGGGYFPTYGEPVDLWLGDYWGGFVDWNCDGMPKEWIDACPTPEEFPEMCDPALGQNADPFLAECAFLCDGSGM